MSRTVDIDGLKVVYREGGEAYLDTLPKAEMHRLDSGHFAVEDSLDEIVARMIEFHDRQVMA